MGWSNGKIKVWDDWRNRALKNLYSRLLKEKNITKNIASIVLIKIQFWYRLLGRQKLLIKAVGIT